MEQVFNIFVHTIGAST